MQRSTQQQLKQQRCKKKNPGYWANLLTLYFRFDKFISEFNQICRNYFNFHLQIIMTIKHHSDNDIRTP